MTDAVAQSPKSSNVASSTPENMEWDSRARRMVMIYLPLSCFVLILLFPFYWMAITSFKPNAELLNYKDHNPFWITSPTLAHIKHLLFNTAYPSWLWTTMIVAISSTFLSLFASTLAAYAIERLRARLIMSVTITASTPFCWPARLTNPSRTFTLSRYASALCCAVGPIAVPSYQ